MFGPKVEKLGRGELRRWGNQRNSSVTQTKFEGKYEVEDNRGGEGSRIGYASKPAARD